MQRQRFAAIIFSVTIFTWLLAAACTHADRPRCGFCGMYVDLAPTWRAGASDSAGKALEFDGPKCLLRWLRMPAARGAGAPWITEYYSQHKEPAASAFFVGGSDVRGPMGDDLVPVHDRPAAERFMREHHGARVVTYEEATHASDLNALTALPHH